jgi:uncharacterized protein
MSFNDSTFAPRLLRQHPSANQNTVTVARGPLIYCAEDVDNEWVDDHFKSVTISPNARLEQKVAFDGILGEEYMVITAPGVKIESAKYDRMTGAFPGFNVDQLNSLNQENVQVTFVPYYYRGNRGGRGHMRVGFKIANELLPST